VPLVEQMHPDTRRGAQRIVRSLAQSIRERDILTYNHSRRVATYAQRLARHMGWSRRLAHDLALSAMVHDLGKTWIDNDVLLKESALSRDERAEMERHPRIGARILDMYGAPTFMVEAVLHHHEAFDGRGYPDHLVGENIPIAARILCVADAFDALTSQRPYKPALDCAQASERLQSGTGTYFDPCVVGALVRLLETRADFVVSRHESPSPPAPAVPRHHLEAS
jgi:putative nucleotidyltransferase with HDIG domain